MKARTHFSVTLRETNMIVRALQERRWMLEKQYEPMMSAMDADERWAYEQELHEMFQLETHILYSDDTSTLPESYWQDDVA